MGSTLFYGTGGVAFSQGKMKVTVAGFPTVEMTEDSTGYVLGAGVESKLRADLSGRLELFYAAFDGKLSSNGYTTDYDISGLALRLGLNYHLN